jgi:6-phosphogluconolactonase/glucosamine-6-phosphate isomerase/deaminase
MKIEVLPDADTVAREAAKFIASEARLAVPERGRFVMAVSGGHTPCPGKRKGAMGKRARSAS